MTTPMNQPPFQPPQQQGPYPPPGSNPPQTGPSQAGPVAPVAKPKRFGFLALGLVALAGLGVGGAIGGSGGAATATTGAAPAPTVTVTSTAPAPAPADTEDSSADDTSDDTSTASYEPKKSDFELGVKTLSKECFGSAGCNVTFRIKPSYVGSQDLPTSGEIEVSYKITGLEDPVENTFTVDGEGTITYTKEEDGQTASKNDKLGAKVTDVEYTP